MGLKETILNHLEQDYTQDYVILEFSDNKIVIGFENVIAYSTIRLLDSFGYSFSYCEVTNNCLVGRFSKTNLIMKLK